MKCNVDVAVSFQYIEVSLFLLPDGGALLLVGPKDVGAAQDQQRQETQRRESQHAAPAKRDK